MAKARALDKRRKSIKNIRKITRTMELVATAQFRRAMERAIAAGSYSERIVRLVGDLARAGGDVSHPLLDKRESSKKAVLLILTANRGMCGGYNGGVLRTAVARFEELTRTFEEVELYVVGKRGFSYLTYRNYKIARSFFEFDDKPAFAEVDAIASELLERYQTGEIDRLDVVYSKFYTLSKQRPSAETLLPLAELAAEETDDAGENAGTLQFEFLPSPRSVLEEIVPTAFKVEAFRCFLDAAVGEQIARMVAMKAATENADEMISSLTTTYNRARQGQITNEILEVVGGANALS